MIQEILMKMLDSLYSLTGNYGLSIILFALVIKLILYYPTHQQFKAMKDMQKIQPDIKKLQALYKDNPQKLQQEQLELFRRHKINPLGGCLPVVIQMPILWGIWSTITHYKEKFVQSAFLWIGSPLSAKYPKYIAKNLASPDFIMLLFYCLSMYLSQKLTVTDPETAKKQALFNIMMPAMFTYIMWKGNFPSALILYWLIFNILTIVQQYFILEEPKRS